MTHFLANDGLGDQDVPSSIVAVVVLAQLDRLSNAHNYEETVNACERVRKFVVD